MHPSLPLLLKLCAAAAGGAAALHAARRLHRAAAVAALRRRVRAAAASLPGGAAPATVLVAGFTGHGKSSFLNTACRALAAESGPLLLRAEAAPPYSAASAGCAAAGAAARRAVRAVVAAEEEVEEEEEEEEEEVVAVDMVEAPALPEPRRMTREDAAAAVADSGGGAAAECVVVVLWCGGPCEEREAAVRKLAYIASAVREKGLHLIVVLTHKKALKTKRQAEELRREVAFRANTDCIFFIENYTSGGVSNLRHPAAVKNDFDTHFTILTIIRQCLEFVKLHRSGSTEQHKSSAPAKTISQVTLEDPKELCESNNQKLTNI